MPDRVHGWAIASWLSKNARSCYCSLRWKQCLRHLADSNSRVNVPAVQPLDIVIDKLDP